MLSWILFDHSLWYKPALTLHSSQLDPVEVKTLISFLTHILHSFPGSYTNHHTTLSTCSTPAHASGVCWSYHYVRFNFLILHTPFSLFCGTKGCSNLRRQYGCSSSVPIPNLSPFPDLLTDRSLAMAPLRWVLRKYLLNEQKEKKNKKPVTIHSLTSPLKECHQLSSCPGLTGRHAAPLCSAGQPETEL